MNPKRKLLLLWILLLILVASGMASCSTVHKIKSTEQIKTDSISIKKAVQIHTAKIDSTRLQQTDSSYKEIITINFDTAAAVPGTPTGELANDYEAAELKPLHGPYSYNIAGNTIRSALPIKSATIERSGHKTAIDLTAVKKLDSDTTKVEEQTHVVTEIKKTTKDKTSRSMPFVLSLLLLLVAVAGGLYALRRYKVI